MGKHITTDFGGQKELVEQWWDIGEPNDVKNLIEGFSRALKHLPNKSPFEKPKGYAGYMATTLLMFSMIARMA